MSTRQILTMTALAAGMIAGAAQATPPPAAPFGEDLNLTQIHRASGDWIFTTASGTGMAAGAQHLVDAQCPDGGWTWVWGDPCGASPKNTMGQIAPGLLSAYANFGEQTFLDAAVAAGDYALTSTYPGNGTARLSTFDSHFLWRLWLETGDAAYKEWVEIDFFGALYNGTYGDTGANYDTADWIAVVETARSGAYINLRPWEFHSIVPAADALGQSGQTSLFEQAVYDGLDTLDAAEAWDLLGLAGGIRGLAFAGATSFPALTAPNFTDISGITDLCTLTDVLLSYQYPNGSWYDSTQTTAYAVLALIEAQNAGCGPYHAEIMAGQAWLRSMQDAADGGYWSSGSQSSKNYSVIGEALLALSTGLGSLVLEATDCQADADPAAGYQIEVELWLRNPQSLVSGWQAFLEYDHSLATMYFEPTLSAYNTEPGHPFTLHIMSMALSEWTSGKIMLDGSVPFGSPPDAGASTDTLLATLVFTVVDPSCFSDDYRFDPAFGFESELSYGGVALETVTVDSPDMILDTVAPAIFCAPDIVTNADAGSCEATLNFDEPFDEPVSVCGVQTPDCWYTDRFAPAVFEQALFDNDNRLKHGVDAADFHPSVPNFYNTQGRKYDIDMPVGTTLAADVYVPLDWQVNVRSLGLWATTFWAGDSVSGYPILNVVSNDPTDPYNPSPLNPSPRFRYYTQDTDQDPSNGYQADYVELGAVPYFDEWYRFEIELTASSYEFRVIRKLTDTVVYSASDAITFGSIRFGNVILQAYNFGETYHGYWDNVTLGPEGPYVLDDCDLTDATLTYERSDNDALTLFDPFPQGDTFITWTATDVCGNAAYCVQTVTVNAVNDVAIEIELAGVYAAATRCIHFVTDTCASVADVELTFTDHDSLPNTPVRAIATVEVPCGPWTKLCVKEEQHTLWSTVTLTDQGTYFEADNLVSLVSGDTDNDSDIDINDVTWLLYQWSLPGNAGGCEWDGTRDADFSLNNNVASEDYTFLTTGWLTYSQCPCSTSLQRPTLGVQKSQVEIATASLPANVRSRVDLNQDGVVNFEDVMLFEIQHNLPADLSTRMWESTEQAQLMRN